jgi:hypothetical protein
MGPAGLRLTDNKFPNLISITPFRIGQINIACILLIFIIKNFPKLSFNCKSPIFGKLFKIEIQ